MAPKTAAKAAKAAKATAKATKPAAKTVKAPAKATKPATKAVKVAAKAKEPAARELKAVKAPAKATKPRTQAAKGAAHATPPAERTARVVAGAAMPVAKKGSAPSKTGKATRAAPPVPAPRGVASGSRKGVERAAATGGTTALVRGLLEELKALGNDAAKRVLLRHGAREPFFGVRIGDLKPLEKRHKGDHALALALYDSGNGDAMYLAGLIADDARMTRADLERWVAAASWYMLAEYTVPWVASGSPHGWEAAHAWIDSPRELTAAAGWATLSSIVARTEDAALDIAALDRLLTRIGRTLHMQANRVRYAMNSFVIALGCYVAPLTERAIAVGETLGKVDVDMGGTSCHVPHAPAYIRKVIDRGTVGKKRKVVKC